MGRAFGGFYEALGVVSDACHAGPRAAVASMLARARRAPVRCCAPGTVCTEADGGAPQPKRRLFPSKAGFLCSLSFAGSSGAGASRSNAAPSGALVDASIWQVCRMADGYDA